MGKVILLGSVIIWALSSFPREVPIPGEEAAWSRQTAAAAGAGNPAAAVAQTKGAEDGSAETADEIRRMQKTKQTENSYIGRLGRFVEPLFAPLGIDWRGGVSLISGFVAKEIVVSTMGVLHATGNGEEEDALGNALAASGMTALSALSMMVFVLLYLPCLATTAAIRRETGSYRWMFFSIGYSTTVAWVAAFLVFQGGRLLGFN
jgi:ferrous iron transport protein B